MKIDCTKLRKLRLKNKLTQAEFAESIGLSQATICDWERKDQEIKADYLIKLIAIFGEDAKDLTPTAPEINIPNTNTDNNANNINNTPDMNATIFQLQKEQIEMFKDYTEFMKKNYEILLKFFTNSKNGKV
jgi:transcriptional regulator with XRE-family HTH domain